MKYATTIKIIAVLYMGLQTSVSIAAAEESQQTQTSKLSSMTNSIVSSCGTTLLESGVKYSAACLVNKVLPVAMDLMEASGRKALGSRFSITDKMSYAYGSGLQGDMDIVFPLAGERGDGADAGADSGAFFMQQGTTIWTGSDGTDRHDLRLGLAHRFQPMQKRGRGDVFGVSLFQQQNLEYGHGRSVFGLDYAAGASSSAAFHYYLPTTGWRAAAPGYEEHALEGLEFSGGFDLPLSLELKGAMGKWRVPGESTLSKANLLDLSWKYNRWAGISANWRESEIEDGQSRGFSLGLRLNIPLGGGDAKLAPRSMGDLLRYAGTRGSGASEGEWETGLVAQNRSWRPVEQKGEILYARRAISDTDHDLPPGVQVAFMNDVAHTGDSIGIKVSLSSPAPEDTQYVLRLRPGKGGEDSPAVEGEDFSSAPMVVLIRKGESYATANARLILNHAMQGPRRLSVKITLLSEEALSVASQ